jgi:hypothetical protein
LLCQSTQCSSAQMVTKVDQMGSNTPQTRPALKRAMYRTVHSGKEVGN